MLEKSSTQWQSKGSRKGVFDGYALMGIKYENAGSFEIGWHITAWRTTIDPIHAYWVAGENFYSATIHLFYKGSPINVIEIYHPPITERIELAERNAVLKAIEEWVTAASPPEST